MIGHVHSIESFGTVDGPGIRLVVFLKGCPLRCQYCHNPDTWEMEGGTDMTAGDILRQYESSKEFYKNGGITVSGGEPLMQTEFVTELFTSSKDKGIHTCLDTSGITFQPGSQDLIERMDKLLAVTDLVMLDIKHIDSDAHKELCGHDNKVILAFAVYLSEKKIPVWIRHVVVPGITFQENHLYHLGRFIGSLTNVKALDVLPYHDMGKNKYKQLEIDYPLSGAPPLPREDAVRAKEIIIRGIRDRRRDGYS